MTTIETSAPAGARLYLDLLKKVLINEIYQDGSSAKFGATELVASPEGQPWPYEADVRRSGMDFPSVAHTMVGLQRLDNVHACLDQILADGVAGDCVETGVWRGGVCIFMRAFLQAHGLDDRTVWVADSFEGLPAPSGKDWQIFAGMGPRNESEDFEAINDDLLSVSLEAVQENFRRYGLLDDRVRFLRGWFRDTLPSAPIEKLALLRLDGDLYESTMDALSNLYPKLSPGGFLIIDDYHVPNCRMAVDDYREEHGIDEPVRDIDGCGAYWRRSL